MMKKPRLATRTALHLAFCSTVLGGALLFALPAQAQVLAPDTSSQPSHSRGVSNNPYGYIQDNGDGGSYGTDDAIGPDTASDNGGSSGGIVAPSDDDGAGGDNGGSIAYGLDGDTPGSLNDFIQGQDDSSDARESKREKAIVKAALDKQRQIRDANIAQRQREQAMIKKAAKQAAGKDSDDGIGSYTADGGDDGYYGPIDDQNNYGGE